MSTTTPPRGTSGLRWIIRWCSERRLWSPVAIRPSDGRIVGFGGYTTWDQAAAWVRYWRDPR